MAAAVPTTVADTLTSVVAAAVITMVTAAVATSVTAWGGALLYFVAAVVDSVMFAVVYIVIAHIVAVVVAALVSSLLAAVLAAPEYVMGNRGISTSFFKYIFNLYLVTAAVGAAMATSWLLG